MSEIIKLGQYDNGARPDYESIPETRSVKAGSRVVVNSGEGRLYDGHIGEVAKVLSDEIGEYYRVLDTDGITTRSFRPEDVLVVEALTEEEVLEPGTNAVIDNEGHLYHGLRGIVTASHGSGSYEFQVGSDTSTLPTSVLRRTYPVAQTSPRSAEHE